MPDEPFVMMSLKGEKAKKLANVLSNKSAAKILTYLAENTGATESKIAKDLKLPISTVNYNMKALVEAKLVVDDEYHYSSRGREVNHYRLARKYIIIAPEEEKDSFWERVKGFVPVALVAAAAGVIVRILSLLTGTGSEMAAAPAAHPIEGAPMAAKMGVAADTMVQGATFGAVPQAINQTVNETARMLPHTAPKQPFLPALFGDWLGWFLLGIFVVTVAAMLVEYLRSRQ